MDLQIRLEGIFRSVFFELEGVDQKLLFGATKVSVATWDSAQHLLLLTCIEEEFEIRIPDDVAIELDSFVQLKAYILSLG